MKPLEENRTRLSLAIRLVGPGAAPQGPVGQVRLAIQGARGKPLVHRSGYWLFLNVPPGQQTLSWESEHYQDGQQSVNVSSVPARAPIVEVPLTAPSPVSITLASLTRGHVGKPYQKPISKSGGKAPFKFEAAGLPAGLSINRVTGTIAGTPTAKGTRQITVKVTDKDLASDSGTTTVTVKNVAPDVNAGADATIIVGATFSSSGSFLYKYLPMKIIGTTSINM